MATKVGGGGHVQENYDPNTGKYVESNGSAEQENSEIERKRKIIEQIRNKKRIDSNLEKIINPNYTEKKKNEVSDEFKQKFKGKFSRIYQKNNPKLFDDLVSSLKNIDNNSYNLFVDAINRIEQVNQRKGKGFFNRYNEEGNSQIALDYFLLENGDYSIYVRNGCLFHEVGHAIDNMLVEKFDGRYAKTSEKYISSLYQSEKYGLTMQEMMIKEFKLLDEQAIREREKKPIDIESETELSSLVNEKERMMNETSTKIIQSVKDIFGLDFSDIKNNPYNGILKNGSLLFYKKLPDGTETYSLWPDGATYIKTEKIREYINDYIKKEDNLNNIDSEIKILKEKIRKSDYLRKKIWGDMSDIMQGFTGKKLTCNIGHDDDYFEDSLRKGERNYNQVVKEMFAELYQGKTVNNNSYKLFKEYFPKTVEIFEEIINKYGGK